MTTINFQNPWQNTYLFFFVTFISNKIEIFIIFIGHFYFFFYELAIHAPDQSSIGFTHLSALYIGRIQALCL